MRCATVLLCLFYLDNLNYTEFIILYILTNAETLNIAPFKINV